MTRQDKYPDTSTFHFHNQNPKNKFTGDCVTRAISLACEIPYNQVVMDMAEIQCKTGYDGCSSQGFNKLLEKYGWIKHQQPRKQDNTKYTGEEFCKLIQRSYNPHSTFTYVHGVRIESRIVANIGGHHTVAIIDGRVNDTWDSTDGCIGNYWVKG